MKHSLAVAVRTAAVSALSTLALVLSTAGPAGAHIEVQAEGAAQAGTGPVTLLFSAESESTTAGIIGVKTQLPPGIAPEDVSLVSAPAGWTLAPTADGFELGGADIGPGVDAEYSVTVALLPADMTELPFKTLQFYSDGREDAWIELATESNPEPEMAAPVLTVAPAPAGATAPPTTTPTTTTTEASPAATSARTAEPSPGTQSSDEGSGTSAIVLVVGLLAVAAIGAGAWVLRSRRSR